MSDLEARSRPAQRHTGFSVGGSSSQTEAEVAPHSYNGRVRTTTNGTIVKAPNDGDVEMGEDKKSVQPLPIPGSFEQRPGNGEAKVVAAASTLSPSDISTPPDAPSSASELIKGGTSASRLALLHPTMRSPRMSANSTHRSAGQASSISPSQWSPGRSADSHLYPSSSQPYVYSSVKPYLSTSFQTSAERGLAAGSGQKGGDRNDMDEDDDVFGNPSQALGLLSVGEPSPPQLRRSNEMEREDGDAAGVFSFSSPCFGPRSLEHSDVPPLSTPPVDSQKRSQRLMSPSWTAATLGKMSLNGTSPADSNAASSSSLRRPPALGQSPLQSSHMGGVGHYNSHSSSGNPAMALSAQSRRLSFNRRPPAFGASKSYHLGGETSGGSSSHMLHPHSPYQRSASSTRSRSRSRTRRHDQSIPRSEMRGQKVDLDDDETDEESMIMDPDIAALPGQHAEDDEDDDATEDEADQRTNRFKAQPIRGGRGRYYDEAQPHARSIGAAIPLHRHPSGQATTMSASYERANSGLNRQYGLDRYGSAASTNYASISRHHPYALGSAGASPSNPVGVLTSHSPSNARIPGMGRRRSSFGNGSSNASPHQAHSMLHQLSHSPRFVNARPAGSSSYYDQSYPNSLPAHAYQASGNYIYGESPESAAGVRRGVYAPTSGLNRQSGHGKDEEEEDEEEEDEEGEEEEDGEEEDEEDRTIHEEREEVQIRKKPPAKTGRSASQTRAAAAAPVGNTSGEVESSEMNEVTAIRERLGGAANCSAFISKLWYLMCRPELYAKYIHWSESGDSVILSNDPDINNEFAAEVLPKLFKHGNNASFVRQLNLYGFQRVPSSRLLDAAETRAAKELMSNVNISTALQLYGPHSSFAHPRFKKDQESLLPSMKPRSSKKTKKSGQGGPTNGVGSDGEDEYGG